MDALLTQHADVTQLVRVSAFQAECCEFESRRPLFTPQASVSGRPASMGPSDAPKAPVQGSSSAPAKRPPGHRHSWAPPLRRRRHLRDRRPLPRLPLGPSTPPSPPPPPPSSASRCCDDHAMKTAIITGCSSGIGRRPRPGWAGGTWTVYATARRPETLSELGVPAADPRARRHRRGLDVAAVEAVQESGRSTPWSTTPATHSPARSRRSSRRRTPAVRDQRVRTDADQPTGAADDAEQRDGRIVNISSMGGKLRFPGGGAYHATKFAVEAFSDALRFEVAGFGSRCRRRARSHHHELRPGSQGVDGSRGRRAVRRLQPDGREPDRRRLQRPDEAPRWGPMPSQRSSRRPSMPAGRVPATP